MTREQIINNMCFTWSHNYGLLDAKDKRLLFGRMAQLFDNNIASELVTQCSVNDHEELTDKLHKAYAEADYECKALSVQLKAKKEENNNLHRLMGQNTETINEAKKARSIVAMLFWEWRKAKIQSRINCYDPFSNGEVSGKECMAETNFYKSHKMLKDNQ